ncbi:MAG TPA: CPBP family glutamic-type intramembrane protease [Microlunatus sp.]|nr:CPBP family glutamic-type intramembrane protease [Microlunatus sp.]
MIYLSLSVVIFACLGALLVTWGVGEGPLLSLSIPAAGVFSYLLMVAVTSSVGHAGVATAHRTSWWTRGWLMTSAASLSGAALVNEFAPSVVLFVVASALGEELTFRRLPVALQYRSGTVNACQSVIYAIGTTTAFVMIHGHGHLLPVADKIVFGICAYLACSWTRSVLVPLAIHVTGNASASVWVSQSGTAAAAWFSIVSIAASLITLFGLHRDGRTDRASTSSRVDTKGTSL